MKKTKIFILARSKNINLKVIKIEDYIIPVFPLTKCTGLKQPYTSGSRLIFSSDGRKVYDTQNSYNQCKTFKDFWPLGMPYQFEDKVATVVLRTSRLVDLIEKTDLVETFSDGLKRIDGQSDKINLTDDDIKSIWKLDDKGRYCPVVSQDEYKNITTYKY